MPDAPTPSLVAAGSLDPSAFPAPPVPSIADPIGAFAHAVEDRFGSLEEDVKEELRNLASLIQQTASRALSHEARVGALEQTVQSLRQRLVNKGG